ncbi:MAG: hypothetical protein JWM82_1593 [Myxococcales bacterium]|jgi:hypothetical protein|nr:hypothetical protein [Myxococcales bacterium]
MMSMSDALDELTYDVEEDGVLVRRQVERVVLAGGAWATVMFLYQERDRTSGVFGAPKISITRFKKFRGAYKRHAAFTLASVEQARALTDTFERWFEKMDETAPEETDARREHREDGERDDAFAGVDEA